VTRLTRSGHARSPVPTEDQPDACGALLVAITNLPLGAPIAPNVHAAPGKPTFTG